MTGHDNETIYVNDAGYDRQTHSLGEVARAGIYWWPQKSKESPVEDK